MRIVLALLVLVSITVLVYFQGLSGGFLLDDRYSLSLLSIFNGQLSVDSLLNYLSHADTGPLGRPISMLSFLLDGNNWPSPAYSFKRTNLIVHLVNGCLLFGIIYQSFKFRISNQGTAIWMGFFSAGFWLLHPFLLSTTLYVVQRMAMLSTLFILLAFFLYLKLRLTQWNQEHGKSNVVKFYLIIYGLTGFAVLSKESGLLLLLLLPLFEVMICQYFLNIKKMPIIHNRLLVQLPVVIFITLFLWKVPDFLTGYDFRAFDMWERFISQSRALMIYLWHFISPSYLTEGVFTDGFRASRNLFEPITTFYACVAVMLTLVVAWLVRKKFVLLSFAVFFFFISHIIESTIVPLELYYEHRNYLAFLFLPLPIVCFFFSLSTDRIFAFLVLTTLLSFTALQTKIRSELWSDNLRLHEFTVEQFPESVRAVQMTDMIYYNQNRPLKSIELLNEAVKKHQSIALEASLLSVKCIINRVNDQNFQNFLQKMNSYQLIKNDMSVLGFLINQFLSAACAQPKHLDYAEKTIEAVSKGLSSYPTMGRSFIDYSRARLLFEQEQFSFAKKAFIDYVRQYGLDKSYVRAVSQFLIAQLPRYALELSEVGLEVAQSEPAWSKNKQDLMHLMKVALAEVK